MYPTFFRPDCLSFQFQCDNGQCIDSSNECNDLNECSDGSDEDDCSDYCKLMASCGKNLEFSL